jgi:tRNA pseudouridine55 synthase
MNLSGVLLVNKPTGITSHDVIDQLRRILDTRRIGHTGTLDPGADGILLICINQATKVAQFLTEMDKEYQAVIKLGVTTDTYDRAGRVIKTEENLNISIDEIKKAILSFTGRIQQTPPVYSAIKQNGKRLYQYARANQKVEARRREVEIGKLEILGIDIPWVHLKIACSKGTYIRSLAFDIGEKLGCGAHLFSLCRTRIGPFKWEDSLSLQKVTNIQDTGGIKTVLLSIEKAVGHLPSVVVSGSFAKKIKDGIPLKSSAVMAVEGDINENQTISLKNEQKQIIAIGKALADTGKFLDLKYPNRLFEYLRVI